MTAIQFYAYSSTFAFLALSIMLSSNSVFGTFLKIITASLALFGFFISLAVSGVVLANGIRLI